MSGKSWKQPRRILQYREINYIFETLNNFGKYSRKVSKKPIFCFFFFKKKFALHLKNVPSYTKYTKIIFIMALDHPAGCVVNYDSFDYNTGEGHSTAAPLTFPLLRQWRCSESSPHDHTQVSATLSRHWSCWELTTWPHTGLCPPSSQDHVSLQIYIYIAFSKYLHH